MKHFLKMKNIKSSSQNETIFSKSAFFQKLLICGVLFSFVFYTHFGVKQEDRGEAHLDILSPALASDPEQPSAKKEAIPLKSLDINKASLEELMALPGIGEKLAKTIISDREAHGPFKKAEDLLRVKGIGPKNLEKISPFLRFEPSVK